MAAIITVTNSEGSRRCDSSCHYAREPKCECVCGGRFHGKALDGTLVSEVEKLGQEVIEELKERGLDVAVDLKAAALSLPPERPVRRGTPIATNVPTRRRRMGGPGLFDLPMEPAEEETHAPETR